MALRDASPMLDSCEAFCSVFRKTQKVPDISKVNRADTSSSCKHGFDNPAPSQGIDGAYIDLHHATNTAGCCSLPCSPDEVRITSLVSALLATAPVTFPELTADSRQSSTLTDASASQNSDDIIGSSSGARSCRSPAGERLFLGLSTDQEAQAAAACLQSCPAPGADCCMPNIPALGLVAASTAVSSNACAGPVLQEDLQGAAGQAAAASPQGLRSTHSADEASDDASDNPITLGTSLFFARVPPTVTYEAIMELFAEHGKVLTLNLFRPWATAKTSKGCGIVVYESITSAVSAMEALNNKYHWTGGETTMVVEWADPSRHRREKPNTKGVFVAKHKSMPMAGSKTRYRAQVRRAVALSLQQACSGTMAAVAAGAQSFQGLSGALASSGGCAGGRAGPGVGMGLKAGSVNRGVGAMLPQLAAAGLAGGSWAGMNLQASGGSAAQQAYVNGLAAAAANTSRGTAASYASGLGSAFALSRAGAAGGAGAGAGGAGVMSGAQGFLAAQDVGLSAINAQHAMLNGWGVRSASPTLASLRGSPTCVMEPSSSAFTATQGGMQLLQQQPGSLPVMTCVTVPQRAPSWFAPAGGMTHQDIYSTGTPTYASTLPQGHVQGQFDGLAQQQGAVSYLGATAGLVADASVLAVAAAAALLSHPATGQHTHGMVGLQECVMPAQQPMGGCSSNACNQVQGLAFVPETPCSNSHTFMGAPGGVCNTGVMSAPLLPPQQQHLANLHRQHYGFNSSTSLSWLSHASCCSTPGAGLANVAFFSAGADLMGAAAADVPCTCEPQAYNLQQHLQQAGATAGLVGSATGLAGGWCDGVGSQCTLGGGAHTGWW